MSIEDRLTALEKRLQAAEDQLEIIRLLNTYGPLVDSGEGPTAAKLWIEGGAYDVVGLERFIAPHHLVSMYEGDTHQSLMKAGCAHLTATPRITLHGDTAEALAYSFVILRENQGWRVYRAAINYWTLVRTPAGWRIQERYNRPIDGSSGSYEVMRKAVA
jgi:hypothetical protein